MLPVSIDCNLSNELISILEMAHDDINAPKEIVNRTDHGATQQSYRMMSYLNSSINAF